MYFFTFFLIRGGGGMQSTLYILDAYHGLYALDLQSEQIRHVVSSETVISTPTNADAVAKLPIDFFNDLDILEDGRIVFSDSSYKHTRSGNRQELLDGAPRGRLFLFDPSKEQLKPVLCGLHFPNGVQLHSSGRVLVNELSRFRVLSVNVTAALHGNMLTSCGEGDGSGADGSLEALIQDNKQSGDEKIVSVFLESAPGCIDNIREDVYYHRHDSQHRRRYLIGVGCKSTRPFSLLWLSYQSNLLRDIVGKLVPMKLVENLVPKYGLVIAVDDSGKIIESFHDPEGHLALVSEAHRDPLSGDLWLGSHSNRFLARIDNTNLSK